MSLSPNSKFQLKDVNTSKSVKDIYSQLVYAIDEKSNSDLLIDSLEKTFRIIFTKTNVLDSAIEEENMTQLLGIMGHKNVRLIELIRMIARLINFLDNQQREDFKTSEKKKVLLKVLGDFCFSEENLTKLGTSMMEVLDNDTFEDFISLLFSLFTKFSNRLEASPLSLSFEGFNMRIFNSLYPHIEKNGDFETILLNKIILNAGASN